MAGLGKRLMRMVAANDQAVPPRHKSIEYSPPNTRVKSPEGLDYDDLPKDTEVTSTDIGPMAHANTNRSWELPTTMSLSQEQKSRLMTFIGDLIDKGDTAGLEHISQKIFGKPWRLAKRHPSLEIFREGPPMALD